MGPAKNSPALGLAKNSPAKIWLGYLWLSKLGHKLFFLFFFSI
jgi:hypothetical protein